MDISVLVVDDDVDFLALATRLLHGMGVSQVSTAIDAASAVAAAQRIRPDAVLVDVGLPDRDGVELGFELAELSWRPRVVLTSTDDDGGATGAGARRALPFVPKEELASGTLRRLLGHAPTEQAYPDDDGRLGPDRRRRG